MSLKIYDQILSIHYANLMSMYYNNFNLNISKEIQQKKVL